jgi:hypothetical protein
MVSTAVREVVAAELEAMLRAFNEGKIKRDRKGRFASTSAAKVLNGIEDAMSKLKELHASTQNDEHKSTVGNMLNELAFMHGEHKNLMTRRTATMDSRQMGELSFGIEGSQVTVEPVNTGEKGFAFDVAEAEEVAESVDKLAALPSVPFDEDFDEVAPIGHFTTSSGTYVVERNNNDLFTVSTFFGGEELALDFYDADEAGEFADLLEEFAQKAAMPDMPRSHRAAGHDVTPGHDELHHYWTKGEGLAKWATHAHPWTALYHHLVKHVNPEMAKRMAAKWFHEVMGFWPGEKHVGAVKVPRGGRAELIRAVVAAELEQLRKFDPHQPRDPEGKWSLFGAAKKIIETLGGPGRGRDLSRDDAAMADVFAESSTPEGFWKESNEGDLALIGLARRQDFDAHPTVVDDAEFDSTVASGGHKPLYRGIVGAEGKTASDIHREVREGTYRPGYGIFGNGYYMAPGRDKAESFSDGTPGSLGRYALNRDAKTITYDELLAEFRERFRSPEWQTTPTASQNILGDFGRFAMARGYDAIHVPAGTKLIGGAQVQREEWVILNRGALIAAAGVDSNVT